MKSDATNDLGRIIESAIESLRIGQARLPGLYEPIIYGLSSGGKRIRPLLCLMACRAMGADPHTALQAALGLEMFHNFTLLHDDVMDRSDTRRGRPSVQAFYGENTAILSGDTMLTLATQMVSEVPDRILRPVLDEFNAMAIDVYEGQQLDMEFEQAKAVSLDAYIDMISKKTGALLGASASIGARIGGASDETAAAFYRYGMQLGLAFQILDDWLDVYGDPVTFGKPIGGDILNDKKTFAAITAADAGQADAIAKARIRHSGTSLVDTVRAIYDLAGVDAACRSAIDRYTSGAIEALRATGLDSQAVAPFAELAARLSDRKK